MGSVVLAVMALVAPVNPGSAIEQAPVYCLDSAGIFQPVLRTNMVRLRAAFRHRFNFDGTLQRTSADAGTLTFRGGPDDAETITYVVRPYRDGMALLDMAVRLDGITDDLSGNDMCLQTFGIVTAP